MGPEDFTFIMGPEDFTIIMGPEDITFIMGPEDFTFIMGPEDLTFILGKGALHSSCEIGLFIHHEKGRGLHIIMRKVVMHKLFGVSSFDCSLQVYSFMTHSDELDDDEVVVLLVLLDLKHALLLFS